MAPDRSPTTLRRAGRGLDAGNSFLADVRTGLGPYLVQALGHGFPALPSGNEDKLS